MALARNLAEEHREEDVLRPLHHPLTELDPQEDDRQSDPLDKGHHQEEARRNSCQTLDLAAKRGNAGTVEVLNTQDNSARHTLKAVPRMVVNT